MAMVLRAMERSTIGLTFLAMHNEKNVVESIFVEYLTFLKRQRTVLRQGLINRHFGTYHPSICTMM
jgi:hypothetical protein